MSVNCYYALPGCFIYTGISIKVTRLRDILFPQMQFSSDEDWMGHLLDSNYCINSNLESLFRKFAW